MGTILARDRTKVCKERNREMKNVTFGGNRGWELPDPDAQPEGAVAWYPLTGSMEQLGAMESGNAGDGSDHHAGQ